MRTWTWGTSIIALLATALLVFPGCSKRPSSQKETDPAYRIEVEQVRFKRKGFFPFDYLIGNAFIVSDKVIPSNYTWYPDSKATAIRMFEDGVERPVLTVQKISKFPKKLNVQVLVTITKGLVVGQGGGADLHPRFREALKALGQAYLDGFYNISVVLCWGKVERRYPFTSKEAGEQYMVDVQSLIFPGASEGSFMSCIEPTLADLDYLQRVKPEKAAEDTLKFGTMPLFFKDSQNWRTNVLLLTDGEPFREGSLDTFTDLIVKGNFPLYTLGVAATTEGEKGLARLRDLYERRKMGGTFEVVTNHEEFPKALKTMVDAWLNDNHSYVVEYVSGFSGERGTEIPLWAAWKDGQYTARTIRAMPGTYHQPLRLFLRSFLVVFLIGGFIYLLYHFRIWPFKDRIRVVPCPEGCGHLIPEDWATCRFCELKGVWGRLVLLNGDHAGKVFFLKAEYYTVGSGPDDDIVVTHLPGLPVQPGHASFHWVQQGQKIVLKVESGPLFVKQRKVAAPAVNLRFGDIIELGEGGVAAVLLRGVGRTF